MQIYGPFRLSTTQSTSGTGSAPGANRLPEQQSAAKPSATPVDQLDLSEAATSVNRLTETSSVAGGGEIRIDRVADLRRQIASGNYETPEKLDAALDRMLDEFA